MPQTRGGQPPGLLQLFLVDLPRRFGGAAATETGCQGGMAFRLFGRAILAERARSHLRVRHSLVES